MMRKVYVLLVVAITAVIAFFLIKIKMIRQYELNTIMFYCTIIFPVMSIMACIVGEILQLIFDFINYNWLHPKIEHNNESREPVYTNSRKCVRLDTKVKYKCDVLIYLVHCINKVNTPLYCDDNMMRYYKKIQHYRDRDSKQAKFYCNLLEGYLLDHREILAQVPEGYQWLKSIHAIC